MYLSVITYINIINYIDMENVIKGYNYEVFIRNYIDKRDDVHCAWLWKDVPEQELFNAGLIIDYNTNRKNRLKSKSTNKNITRDVGLDIIQLNNDKEYVFVQCKNYSKTFITKCQLEKQDTKILMWVYG